MRTDAHQHFWTRSDGFYDWLTPDLNEIYRDFSPEDLAPLLSVNNVARTILVQAAPSLDETKQLLALAKKTDFIVGVIGWVDMTSDDVLKELASLMLHPLFKGVRPMVQDLADPSWLLKPELESSLEFMAINGLVFEALVRPQQWSALLAFAERYRTLTIVVDHGAKPAIVNGMKGDGGFIQWADMIERLSANEHVSCKLSGLLTEAAPDANLKEIQPYLDHLYDCFGADRLMWGSDWPVLGLRADYGAWVTMFDEWLRAKPAADRSKILGATASRLYGLSNQVAKTALPKEQA